MVSKKDKNKSPERKGRAADRVGYIYLLLMLGVFPLFYRNNYIDIMESKWLFFKMATLISALVMALCLIASRIAGAGSGSEKKDSAQGGRAIGKLPFHEWMLLFFMGAMLISWLGTIKTDYFSQAWDGSIGKLAGVYMYLMLFLAYLMVSRHGSFDQPVRQVYLWANFIVFSLAVLNHFMVDPLNMYVNLDPEQYWMFCSTMGNINVLSGYFSVFVPVTVALFMYTPTGDGCILYGIIMAASFMGVVAANGDAGIIGVLAGFVFLLWPALAELGRLRRYMIAVALFFTSAAVIGNMDDSFAEGVKEPLETVPALIAKPPLGVAAMALSWLIVVILYLAFKKNKGKEVPLPGVIRKVCFGMMGLVILACLAVFAYFSLIDRDTPLGGWETYLRFSDLWGSSRGFTWKRTLAIFGKEYSLFEKLFGVGPDLMIVPYHTYYHEQIMEKMGAYLADAHSEFMQTLGTMGITGVLGYFGFQLGGLVRLAGQKDESGLFTAISAGLAAYMVQGMLCSQQTFSTPVFFIMLALGEKLCRDRSAH